MERCPKYIIVLKMKLQNGWYDRTYVLKNVHTCTHVWAQIYVNSLLNYFWTDICINGKSNGGTFYYTSILLKCYEHFLIQNNQIGNF